MANKNISFVIVGFPDSRTQRELQLDHAIIKSHAARVGHERRKVPKSSTIRLTQPKNRCRYGGKPKEYASQAFCRKIGSCEVLSEDNRSLGSSRLPMHIKGGGSPFTSLPVKVSVEEQQLLRFWFSEGRRLFYGNSVAPAFCPSLHLVRQGALERSSAYVQVHIIIAEYMLSKLCAVKLSDNFYRRRSRVYKLVVDMISEPYTNFGLLLEAVMYLHLAEHVLDQSELQVHHLKALDELVELKGGLRSLSKDDVHAELGCYATHWIVTAFPTIRNSTAATNLSISLLSLLRRVRAWTQRQRDDSTATEKIKGRCKLTNLREYLWTGVDQYLRDLSAPYPRVAGYFYLLVNLCATMSEWGMSPAEATRFLVLLQEYMKGSVDGQTGSAAASAQPGNEELHCLPPPFVSPLIPHVAREIVESKPTTDHHTSWKHSTTKQHRMAVEIAITEATVKAMKAFALLSASVRLKIAVGLFQCCMVTSDPTRVEPFGERDLTDLASEMQCLSCLGEPTDQHEAVAQTATSELLWRPDELCERLDLAGEFPGT